MKKTLILVALAMFASATTYSQSWKELTREQKMEKVEAFRADNQRYLRENLGMSQAQLDDIDNVNVCYLSSLDRIDRYGGSEDAKEKYAKAATAARSAQLDAIMGVDKRKQFQDYVKSKMK